MTNFENQIAFRRISLSDELTHLDFSLLKDHYFGTLAQLLHEHFQPTVASIWDNNFFTNVLVHQASHPIRNHNHGRLTIPANSARVGYAIERCNIYADLDVSIKRGHREFLCDSGLGNSPPQKMLHIPVPATCDYQWVNFTIGLSYDNSAWNQIFGGLSTLEIETTLNWLPFDIGRSLANFVNRISSDIRREVETLVLMSHDITSLFQLAGNAIRSRGVLFDSLNLIAADQANTSVAEFTTIPRRIPDLDADLRLDALISKCKSSKGIVADNVQIEWKAPSGRTAHNQQLQCDVGIVPVTLQIAPKLELGYLVAKCNQDTSDPYSFGAIDLHILSCYARSLATCWERYQRGKSLISAVSLISRVGIASRETASLEQREAIPAAEFVVKLSWRTACKTLSEILACDEASYRLTTTIDSNPIVEDCAGNKIAFPLNDVECAKISESGFSIVQPNLRIGLAGHIALGVVDADRNFCGIVLLSRPKTTSFHPEPYFTNMDITTARATVGYLGLVTSLFRSEGERLSRFQFVAQTLFHIAGGEDEDSVFDKVFSALKRLGYRDAMISLYDGSTNLISGYRSMGSKWEGIVVSTIRSLDDSDILALCLRENREVFVRDSRIDGACAQSEVKTAKIVSQYIVPLKIENELIGTLQIDLGDVESIPWEQELVLKSFGYHMAIVVSRMRRGLAEGLRETESAMSSSRFVAAEALSGLAVHQFSRRLRLILDEIADELKTKNISENPRTFLVRWRSHLENVKEDLANALDFLKGCQNSKRLDVHLQDRIQPVVDVWIRFIRAHNARVSISLDATSDKVHIPEYIFREILSVLIVNAIQAHAKNISIRSFNYKHPDLDLDYFCVDVGDDGDGIDDGDIQKIFEPGFTTKPGEYGTGLGLFIARRLANNGSGDICLKETKLGKGTKFRIKFPVAD